MSNTLSVDSSNTSVFTSVAIKFPDAVASQTLQISLEPSNPSSWKNITVYIDGEPWTEKEKSQFIDSGDLFTSLKYITNNRIVVILDYLGDK